MNMEVGNQQLSHRRMRRAGTPALALMMLTRPFAAISAFALTSSDESQLDVAVIRARAGQYLPKSELFAVTAGVDPTGPVHGGGYAASAGSESFALTSGVDPAGPIHGSSLSCLGLSEPDMLC